MTEKLKQLKAKKKNILRALTNFLHLVETGPLSVSKNELKNRLERLEPRIGEFEDIVSEIEAIDETIDLGECKETFEDKYYKAVTLAREILNKDGDDGNAGYGTARIDSVGQNQNGGQLSGVRLPDLELPKFAGEYHEWYKFKDTFNNPALNLIQKYYYLNSCFKGSAKKIIESLEVAEANYSAA